MDVTLDAVDDLLSWSAVVSNKVTPNTLREWRFDLIRSSVYLHYAADVLSLDLRILKRGLEERDVDLLQSLVDEMPALLADSTSGDVAEQPSNHVAADVAVAELAINQASGLLALHRNVLESELHDLAVLRQLIDECERHRDVLIALHQLVEERVNEIQTVMRHHYATGAASTDDWLR